MSFISEDNFDIVEEQYQELLQSQAADQESTTAMAPVYTQFNASYEEAKLYVLPGPSTGEFSNSQYGASQDQIQPETVPHFGDWETMSPSNPIVGFLSTSPQVCPGL
ncbi:hypothetical protein DSO57_1002978 [Entomophthora muscae]|uniref:Uncharacterized protein n=1 Tax=Entomophthora muscae TaxID=34485 RepID=A0ACC2U705_9FUNG|nr:hypothetical protein DSO57_1002978 [Entomophthora muscae]